MKYQGNHVTVEVDDMTGAIVINHSSGAKLTVYGEQAIGLKITTLNPIKEIVSPAVQQSYLISGE